MPEKHKKFTFKKPPVIATALTIVSLGILLSLANWQWTKYAAKTLYHSDICTQEQHVIRTGKFSAIEEQSISFCPGKAHMTGTIDPEFIIPIGPRVQNGAHGYHIYSLLRAQDDNTGVLLNLGWAASKNPPLQIPKDPVQITGHLIKPGKPSMFSMPNTPEDEAWITLDVEAIINHYTLENIAPHVLIRQSQNAKDLSTYIEPAKLSNTYLTPQMHLQYALFWSAMTLALAIIFLFRFVVIKPQE